MGVYVPRIHECVVGKIVGDYREHFLVDIGAVDKAYLSKLAHREATRRNRLNYKHGELIYARITSWDIRMGCEISCTDFLGESDIMGVLKGGITQEIDSTDAKLLASSHEGSKFLSLLAEYFPFEIAIGANGLIWINSISCSASIILITVIKLFRKTKMKDIATILSKATEITTAESEKQEDRSTEESSEESIEESSEKSSNKEVSTSESKE
ncbi:Exosome complex RNA-binding protein 1/RRP40/RRP4 like protein [Aduncisulcus paluster]|uniref:Exosome complex RNA-binding protein 1/RRP40/RRP4 like protein n=1 Tax=Aduncisulcus paluster TaxID=2918883 RepID=A0ABQ5K1Q4_9EUKA|nr:Exosome complex RNA-binding protein 1/RRP40/RRP4 like protein [Aduncisulcus paluster]